MAFFIFFGVFSIAVILISCRQSLQVWDESRIMNNALELAASKTWIVTKYNGLPDHWYTKPPLYPWIVTALLDLGVHPIPALRLPSIFASLLSVLEIYFFSAVFLRRPFAGIVGALLLTCSVTFFGPHVGLTGDLDALLSLLEVTYVLCFWAFVEDMDGAGATWLLLSCISLALAAMTKGIAGVMLLPGLFAFVLLRHDRFKVLSNWRIWAGLAIALLVTLSYYMYRNQIDPGYLHAVVVNEIERFGVTTEGHGSGPLYYVIKMFEGFEPGIWAVVFGCLVVRKSVARDERSRSAAILCGVVALVFLLALTKSKTKMFYYHAPALPLLSLFGALGIVDTSRLVLARLRGPRIPLSASSLQWCLPMLLAIFAAGMTAIRAKHVEAHFRGSEPMGYTREFSNLARQGVPIHQVVLLEEPHEDETGDLHYFPVEEYWAKTVAKQQNVEVAFASNVGEVPDDSWVISCNPRLSSLLDADHRVDHIADSAGHCLLELTKASQVSPQDRRSH